MRTRRTRTWLVTGMVTLVAGAFAVPAIAQDDDRPAPQAFHDTMLDELGDLVGEDTAAEVGDVLSDLAAEHRATRGAGRFGQEGERPDPEARQQEMLDLLAAEMEGEELAAVEEALDTLHEARMQERAEWRAEREEMRGDGFGPRGGGGMGGGGGRGLGPHSFDGDCPLAEEAA